MSESNVRIIDGIEAVRLRPAMYVGSTGFFGFIQYLVCPVALLLAMRPTRIAVAAGEGGFQIESDVALPIVASSDGRLSPFETTVKDGPGHGFEGLVLNALSQSLSIEVRLGARCEIFEYRRGRCLAHEISELEPDGRRTTLQFVPDDSIFTVTAISPAIFTSYLRRLSFLYAGVRFTLTIGSESQDFYNERGIVDLFAGVSAPYQILHEPFHILVEEGSAKLEVVFAYHSWKENALWCFINNGRVVEGGTHEQGLHEAIEQLYGILELPKVPKCDRNGVVGIMSLHYPDVVYEGCVKLTIGNPELRELICNWVVQQTMAWIKSRPDVAEQLRRLETFQFPEAWVL
jgi:DNA gyrase/topoisomerase IV subunit B